MIWPLMIGAIASLHPTEIEGAPRLKKPGDSTTMEGVAIMLHIDSNGQEFVSAMSTTSIKTYGDYTHIHDFGPAVELEERLFNLTTEWRGEPKNLTSIVPSSPAYGASGCDCNLAPLKEVLGINHPRRTRWKFDHKEIQNSEICPHQREEVYETMLNHPSAIEPICTIAPSRWTQHHMNRLRQTEPREVVKQMNHEAQGPCAQEGSYNLRSLPRERVHEQNATSIIDCALQCLFMTKCTAWTFDTEGNPRCWSINTGYLRPNFIKGPDGPYITGSKECIPCLLRRRIEIETSRGNTDARKICRLDASTGWKTAAKCACSRQKTLNRFRTLIEDITHTAQTNSIRETPKRRGRLSLLISRVLRELRTTRGGLTGLAQTLTMNKGAAADAARTPTSPLIQKFKQLVGPGVEVYAKLVPISKLLNRRRGSPKPETVTHQQGASTRYTPTAGNLNEDLEALGTGRKATARAIEANLKATKRFLETAETQKARVLQMEEGIPGYKDVYNDPNTDIIPTADALTLTVDAGAKAAQIAIYAHRGTAQSTTITTMPLPTMPPAAGYVPGGIKGHWTSPNQYNRAHPVRSITEACASELRARLPAPAACHPGQATEPMRRVMEVRIDQRGKILRMLRITQDPARLTPLAVTCGTATRHIKTLGILLVMIGEACSITDAHGHTLAPTISTGGQNSSDNHFETLFDKALTPQAMELDATDTIQLVMAGALILVAALTATWLLKNRKKKSANNPDATEPLELEHLHPEAKTPPKTPNPT